MLNSLGKKYGTDKVKHGFCDIYHTEFENIRHSVKNVLEVGVFFGSSINMWSEYFPNAKIWGVDTFEGKQGNGKFFKDADKYYNEWTDKSVPNYDRIVLHKVDQSSETELQKFVNLVKEKGVTFDIILDDASHLMREQQITLKYLLPIVKKSGYFIIEDTHTSLENGYDIEKDYSNTTLRMLDNWSLDSGFVSKYCDMSMLNDIESVVTKYKVHNTSAKWQMTDEKIRWMKLMDIDSNPKKTTLSMTSVIKLK
jgi:hypothetical protein